MIRTTGLAQRLAEPVTWFTSRELGHFNRFVSRLERIPTESDDIESSNM